jgi:hypothetical protein
MMMVPRSFVQNPLVQGQQQAEFNEKERFKRRRSREAASRSPTRRSTLSESLSQEGSDSTYRPVSNPVKIPVGREKQQPPIPQRPGPSTIQTPTSAPAAKVQAAPRRRQSAQELLSSTTIPIRRKQRQRPSQRIPGGDYVADFSKLLRDDVQAGTQGVSASWSNPQFEGLFGNIDGLVEGQMIVGSEGIDEGILSSRSLSAESMPSLSSVDDFSSISPATFRSPSDHRLRLLASSEDASTQHPLLHIDEEDTLSFTSSNENTTDTPLRSKSDPAASQRSSNMFKSSLTASLRALKSAAQTVSNIATTPPLLQPEDFLSRSVFDFRPGLTDDRRPPPSEDPPSPALRRYLNPNTFVPPDSPAQLHFWLDEKPTPGSPSPESKPKIRIKRKYQRQRSPSPNANERAPFTSSHKKPTSNLPPIVPLATCIPSSIRTANASSPPIWLSLDGTPSNKSRAAQTLFADPEHAPNIDNGQGQSQSQTRPREPRENRDFLRVFVAEMNMRRIGKLEESAVGRAKLWLPAVSDDGKKALAKDDRRERWHGWTVDDL